VDWLCESTRQQNYDQNRESHNKCAVEKKESVAEPLEKV